MIDESKLDETKARCEKKFVIAGLSSFEIENILRLHPALFFQIFKERRVNNIYLDSHELNNYLDNLNGNSPRLKIRIRWYGKTFGAINPKLELKIKNNEFGWKLIFPLKQFNLDKNFSDKILYRELFSKSELPKLLSEMLKLYSPVVLNSYKRKYFISADKKYRFTLDKDMTYYKLMFGYNSFKHKFIDRENKILELKYKQEDYEIVHRITQHLPFRLSNSSKYVGGIDTLEI